METTFIILGFIGIFITGAIVGFLLVNYFRVEPFLKQHKELINTLEKANHDNLKLMMKIKFLENSPFGSGAKIEITQLSPEQGQDFIKKAFGQIHNKEKREEEESKEDQKAYYIEQLTLLGAKGWTHEDSLEELKRLYDLL